MSEQMVQKILESRIIAIVRGVDEDKILPLAKALYTGGIHMIEVTFDQSRKDSLLSTARKISLLREKMGELIYPGAGTVMTAEQVEVALKAGAMYIISPNTDAEVIQKTKELGAVSMPGALTPSEACMAHAAGADFVKIFPAGSLGTTYVKDLCAPLNHIRFLAVGGIGIENARAFLDAGAVGLGIGGKLVNKSWVETEAYSKITEFSKQLVQAVEGNAH